MVRKLVINWSSSSKDSEIYVHADILNCWEARVTIRYALAYSDDSLNNLLGIILKYPNMAE